MKTPCLVTVRTPLDSPLRLIIHVVKSKWFLKIRFGKNGQTMVIVIRLATYIAPVATLMIFVHTDIFHRIYHIKLIIMTSVDVIFFNTSFDTTVYNEIVILHAPGRFLVVMHSHGEIADISQPISVIIMHLGIMGECLQSWTGNKKCV